MPYRDLKIIAGQSRHKRGGSIPMYQHHIRAHRLQHLPDPVHDIHRHIEQRLPVLHDRQVVVRNHGKSLQHLVQHLTVLTGHAHYRLYLFSCLQFIDQRTHLDRLRPGPEYQHYFFHAILPSVLF